MSDATYRRLIDEVCATLGLPESAVVAESQHLVLGETTVGLMHDPDVDPQTLFIYFDLGPIPAPERTRVQEGMLRSNLRPDADATGHFGIHPETGHAVWHVRLRGLDAVSGADLAGFLAQQATGLDGWMERVAEPVRGARA